MLHISLGNKTFQISSLLGWDKVLMLLLMILLGCDSTKVPPEKKDETKKVLDAKQDTTTQSVEPAAPKILHIDYDTSQWTELSLQNDVLLDLRYATTNNFVKEQLYDCSRCFLRPAVAKAVLNAQRSLREKGLRFKLFDCFRPLQVQERLWEKVPDATYVTSPSKGSMHNRGTAIDLTLVNGQGEELNMGTEYDFFGPAAHHTFEDLPDSVLENRSLLKTTMEEHGFGAIRTEWWHYSYREISFPLDTMQWSCE